MKGIEWVSGLLKLTASSDRVIDRYWETEGLCKFEIIPQFAVPSINAGPAMLSAPRKYCVKR